MRIYRIYATIIQQGENMTIGKQIRKRRKELKMSVDELANRIGKDRSTVYRYENGDIENFPIELLFPMTEALETTPQELLSTIVTTNEWLSAQAEKWFEVTEGYEFNSEEFRVLYAVAKYLMQIRNDGDYEEKLNCLYTLFKQLNQ